MPAADSNPYASPFSPFRKRKKTWHGTAGEEAGMYEENEYDFRALPVVFNQISSSYVVTRCWEGTALVDWSLVAEL